MRPEDAVKFCAACSIESWPTLTRAMANPVARGFLMDAIEQTEGSPAKEREAAVVAVAKFGLSMCGETP